MWRCPNCGESIVQGFESCWICGTKPDGEKDPKFVPADEYEPERFTVSFPKQYQLGALFLMAAALAMLLFVRRARIEFVLIPVAMALSLYVTSWILAWLVRKR